MSLIAILLWVLFIAVIIWATKSLLEAFAVPQPMATVIWVIVVVLCFVALIDQAGLLGGGPVLRIR